MTQPLIDLNQFLPPFMQEPEPPLQLQREIEELGASEIRRAFLDLQADAEKLPAAHTITCSRMAIANEGGPAGQVYSVLVILRREMPRD